MNKESQAYRDGFTCGRSKDGQADENPYKHRLSKKRKEWHQGWMDGGAIYLNECQKCMSSPCRCLIADALAGWVKTAPDSEGEWEMRCMENNQQPDRMPVFNLNGELWVNCPEVGKYPVQLYHDNLCEIQWRKVADQTK